MSDPIATSLAGVIYRNAIAISDPAVARNLAQEIIREFDVVHHLVKEPNGG